MNTNEILNYVFNLLDETIKKDFYFINLKDIISNIPPGEFLVFDLAQNLLNKIQDNKLKKNFSALETPEEIMQCSISTGTDIYSIIIKIIENALFIEFKKEGITEIAKTIYCKNNEIARIENTKLLIENGYYQDYNCQIYYYDNNFKPVTMNEEFIQEELDDVFSKEFEIPLKDAHEYRVNFKKYAPNLSEYHAIKQMEEFDNDLDERDFCTFLSPFYIDDFNDFLNEEIKRRIDAFLWDTYGDNQEFIEFNSDNIKFIIDNLKEQIGVDGKIVISQNIVDNLLMIILNLCACGISTKGYIIKKINNEYILYFVHIINNQVISVKKSISITEAQALYHNNNANEEIEGLNEFFDITRIR